MSRARATKKIPAGAPATAVAGWGAAARRLWTLDPRIAFLNHGSFGATPRAVLEAQAEWRRRMEREPVQFMAEVRGGLLREAASVLAAYLRADGEDLVFVDNATTGINVVAASVPLAPGDEVVTTSQAYPAVRLALEAACRRGGARLVEAALPFPARDPDGLVDAVEEALSPRTRLLVVDHVVSATAVVLPVARLAALARGRGVPVLIDGAHAPGMLALDVPGVGADFYVGNCHKWLCAPKGAGFLWSRANARAHLHPLVVSHGSGMGYLAEFDWTGTRDPTPFLSVPAAIAFRFRFGEDRLRAYIHDLAAAAGRLLADSWSTEMGAPKSMFGAMTTVRVPGTEQRATLADAECLRDRLYRESGIEVPFTPLSGALWARLSAFAYNEMDDYRRLAAALAAGAAR